MHVLLGPALDSPDSLLGIKHGKQGHLLQQLSSSSGLSFGHLREQKNKYTYTNITYDKPKLPLCKVGTGTTMAPQPHICQQDSLDQFGHSPTLAVAFKTAWSLRMVIRKKG